MHGSTDLCVREGWVGGWLFGAGVSFCRVSLLHCSVRLGCIWDIDEKGWGQNVAFFLSEGIVCVIGLSKRFISRVQNGCVKFAVQALRNWQKSILLKMSGSGAWSFLHLYFACYVFLIKMKEAYWCGSHWAFSHREVISCYMSISLLADIRGLWSVTLIWKSATAAYLEVGLLCRGK